MLTLMRHDVSPDAALREAVGDISGIQVFNNQVLVAVYIRPKQTAGGILMPDSVTDEDKYQGKIGLILKKGPSAFVDPTERWFSGAELQVGDWVLFRPSDGWGMTINKQMCRMMEDIAVRARVSQPDMIW